MPAEIGRALIVVGLVVAAIGLALTIGPRLPLVGRLPGDIYIRRGSFSFYFPIVTCIVLSLLLTLLLNLLGRR